MVLMKANFHVIDFIIDLLLTIGCGLVTVVRVFQVCCSTVVCYGDPKRNQLSIFCCLK